MTGVQAGDMNATLVLALPWLAGAALAGAVLAGKAAEAPASIPDAKVVGEPFTSQGCSSCPPADALLRRLGSDPALREQMLPLAFHVDSWDALGWKDPFSSPAWSERQTAYARAFGSARIYTPQAVVDGRAGCVGSDEDELRSRVE